MFDRRHLVKSAPPLSRLPRLDSPITRRELVEPSRRQATARLRRQFLESRQSAADDKICVESKRATSAVRRQSNKDHHYNNRNLQEKCREGQKADQKPTSHIACELEGEISKRGIPERLAFVVPIHLPDSKPTNTLTDSSNTALSLFHTVKTRTLPRAPTSGTNRHYFIEREWSSERISLARFKKFTPELYRRSWIG